ncbi:MAG: diacylglycerol/lipid kinase family protein [Promethearchaeota archaeon]
MKDYAIIYNPACAAGKTKKDFDYACKTLDNLHVSYKVFQTEYFLHAITLSEQLAKDGYSVIAAGGDGTCNEVLNGVVKSNTNELIGFIPVGSGNDIPGAIGIIPNVKRACEIIAEGNTGKNDVGLTINAKNETRYFLGIGSQGFDGAVAEKVNAHEKKYSGTWNYVIMLIKTIFQFKKRAVRVTMDHDIYEGSPNNVAIGNGESYGEWMYLCGGAKIDDGLFNISIPEVSPLRVLMDLKKMYSKTVLPHPGIKTFQSKKVRVEMIEKDDDPYIGQVDGELIGTAPIIYECIPNAYEFIKPKRDETLDWFMKKHGKKYLKHCIKFNLTPKINN